MNFSQQFSTVKIFNIKQKKQIQKFLFCGKTKKSLKVFLSHKNFFVFYVSVQYFFFRENAWMAEGSKAVDLSSILFGGVGSNPTSSNFNFFPTDLVLGLPGFEPGLSDSESNVMTITLQAHYK